MGVSAAGEAIAIWKYRQQGPPFTASVRTRRYNGSTWNAMQTLASDVFDSPSIASGTAGHAFATFGSQQRVFTPGGAAWTDPALSSTPALTAVDGSGNKMLLFRSGANLDARRLTAAGVLEPARRLSTNVSTFHLASNGGNRFAAVYDIGSMLVLGRYSSGNWSGVDFASSGTSPRIAIDSSGNLLVAWISGNTIRARRVVGSELSATATVATYPTPPRDLRLVVNASGRAIATWKRDVSTTVRISAASFLPPASWSPATLVATATASPESPPGRPGVLDVGIDDCGAAQLLYETAPYTANAVRYTPATGWATTPTQIGVTHMQNPRMATAANGTTTVVWDGENVNVLARRYE